MFRYLVLPTLIALLLIPDWASAFFRRRATPAVVVPAQKVQYAYAPAPQCPPMFLAPVACCPPATVAPVAPQVVPERMATPKSVVPEAVKPTPAPIPTPEKLIEPKLPSVVPNGASRRPEAPPIKSVPEITITPVVTAEVNLPPISVPLTPVPALPKLTLDPIPAKELAPELKVTPDAALPAFVPLPAIDTSSLPPLAVPREVEVKSSPIHAEKHSAAYEMFPVVGNAPVNPDEKRIVTFYNFSGRELMLTINGKTYNLPAKHTIEGKLGTQFKMRIGAGEDHEVNVPMSATGADVVLKK